MDAVRTARVLVVSSPPPPMEKPKPCGHCGHTDSHETEGSSRVAECSQCKCACYSPELFDARARIKELEKALQTVKEDIEGDFTESELEDREHYLVSMIR